VATSVALVAVAGACEPAPVDELALDELVGELAPDSQLVGCDRAAEAVTVTVSSHLDPACTYTQGITVTASGTTLDCRGARIESLDRTGSRGVTVTAPTSVALTDVTVRNCVIEGFLNNVRVTRAGFKDLPPGDEYQNAFADIVLENSHLYNSRGSGVFVDGYVTDVTLRDLDIAGSGSVGIYLEAGSKGNVVERNHIHENGYKDTYGEGVPFDFGGTQFRYHSTGREGLAIDGSRDNVVRDNLFEQNANGALFLYKNCGEYATERPDGWWHRPYGADGNLIEGNRFVNEPDGVWVGSRMSENQFFMDCSDPTYIDGPVTAVHLDRAQGNTIRDNDFEQVRHGVRVEDDGTVVEGNRFSGIGADGYTVWAVVVGTEHRTQVLGQPVGGVVVTGNTADIVANPTPYGWIHDPGDTAFAANTSAGAAVEPVQTTQPTRDPFLMVREIFLPE
jgi:hypothetical protein